jgi:hypothetical protein
MAAVQPEPWLRALITSTNNNNVYSEFYFTFVKEEYVQRVI